MLKTITFSLLAITLIIAVFISIQAYRAKARIREMFTLNKQLQEQNYYMAEFEFKGLGIAYHLGKWEFAKSAALMDRLHEQLITKKGLIKMPDFKSKEEELEFYLNLQNPKTGAFMDDAYPLCTYHGPTENVILHIESLVKELDRPLKLKYRLKYLDRVNTPEKLVAYLDDISTMNWIAAKLPQTSFHNARDILTLARDFTHYDPDNINMVIQKHGLYNFSPEWRHTLLKWFYEHQDPKTGLWGPKSKDGKLLKKDTNNTSSILKAFVDKKGNDIHPEFPLRYKDKLFASTLETLATAFPADDNLDDLHEWNLRTPKSLRLLTRYLWKDSSRENQELAKKHFENYIRILFNRYYIPQEGGFSYYPDSSHATLDGVGGFYIFREIGAFSSEKQHRLWGSPDQSIVSEQTVTTSSFQKKHLDAFIQSPEINSLRIYDSSLDLNDLTKNVLVVVYPGEPVVPDILDLTPRFKHWINTTPLTMGNWISKASVQKDLENIDIKPVPVLTASKSLNDINTLLSRKKHLVIIGFDVLQVPRMKLEIHLKNNRV